MINVDADEPGSNPGDATFHAFTARTTYGGAAEGFTALEVATNLRAAFVDGAEPGDRIESDTCTVAVLVHATDAGVFDDQFLGHVIVEKRRKLGDKMAANAATGAGGKVVERVVHRCQVDHAQMPEGCDLLFLSLLGRAESLLG